MIQSNRLHCEANVLLVVFLGFSEAYVYALYLVICKVGFLMEGSHLGLLVVEDVFEFLVLGLYSCKLPLSNLLGVGHLIFKDSYFLYCCF